VNDDRLIIREYDNADAAEIHACVVELQDSGRLIDPRLRPGEEMAEFYLNEMHARCRKWSGAILVAEVDGAIAGFTMIVTKVPYNSLDEPPGDYALVAELIVREGFRRRGIATRLLEKAEQYARAAGATVLQIGVLSENRGARDLYLQMGFAPYSETLWKQLL
jgi:ribosomal protein S18 acetylase RimI-like enzyme